MTTLGPGQEAGPRLSMLAAGDHALLIEVSDNQRVHALAAVIRARLADVLEEVVPGHRTLLLSWCPGALCAERLRRTILTLARSGPAADAQTPRKVRIPVVYDGADLEFVAAAAGVSADAIPALHTGASYTAAFIGFSPGFAYLTGGDPQLNVPRRASPRVSVPSGAVAVAGGYSAVYPTAGPGGWHVIGHTSVRLFDPGAAEPVLIPPGTTVVFDAV